MSRNKNGDKAEVAKRPKSKVEIVWLDLAQGSVNGATQEQSKVKQIKDIEAT